VAFFSRFQLNLVLIHVLQVSSHVQLETMTDEQLLHSLGVNARSIMVFDRYALEELTDEELEMLNAPFREIVDTLNARYGTNIRLLLPSDEGWHRDYVINRLSGGFPFDVWFNMMRQLVQMDIYRMQNNAFQISVLDNYLDASEFESLQYGIEYSYITVADAAHMLRDGYELRDIIDVIESQISDVSVRSGLVLGSSSRDLWNFNQSLAPWGYNHVREYFLRVHKSRRDLYWWLEI